MYFAIASRSTRFGLWLLRRGLVSAFVLGGLVLSISSAASAASSDPEDFHFEVTGSAWFINNSGQIQAGSLPIDLRGDLGVRQNEARFFGKLVVKPGRKHRIIVEGTPYELSGDQTLTRSVVYQGQTFDVDTRVRSTASLTYLFAGYQYDFISKPAGHFGVQVGGAYLDATGTLTSIGSLTGAAGSSAIGTVTASKSQNAGLPLIGAEFRVSPIPGVHLFEVNGEFKGMNVGDYGHYMQGALNAGIRFGLLTAEAGYRIVDADIHDTGVNRSGVSPRFKGPVVSLVFRY